jgi:tetratricopeptide (TPR) repeat protein
MVSALFYIRGLMDPSQPSASTTAAHVAQIRALLRQQKFSEALHAGRALLAQQPQNREGLLFVATAHRYLGQVPEALQTLALLEQQHPRFSRLYEERGNCLVFLKQAPQAIDAFLIAVNINHALPNSWRMLEGLYRMTGQSENLAKAASHVATLQKIPAQIVTATAFFMDGDLDVAEAMVRAYLLQHGDHVEAMRLLARIGISRKVFDDAEILLAAVLQLAPGYRAARREYAEVLIELHQYQEARNQLRQLLDEEPQERFYKMLYASTAVGLGEQQRAVELYRELLQGTPEDADVHLSIAHGLKTLGQRDAAIAAYREAARCRPSFGDAYWSLANLKTYQFDDAELTRLRQLEADPAVTTVDRYHLSFALGKALEDRGEYRDSFRYYAQGNAAKRVESNYRSEIIEDNTSRQIQVCSRAFFAERRGWGAPDPDPIFIVGLPRSGSTLIEQILASHSQVEGTQELANVQQIVANLRGRDPDPSSPRYPAILAHLGAEDFRQLGAKYIADTRIFRGASGVAPRAYFIDKMPNNFRHLGLIHLMLPNAKIIDARREPMACCFSNLKQLFAQGQEFTYSVEDIARYYRTYVQLMRHWDSVLPGRILRVMHEDVVDDLEGKVRRVLEFCGLEFEPQCIEFHKTVRSVRTASSEQVRQPISREGLEQWKYYEPWLDPLKQALGDVLAGYRA